MQRDIAPETATEKLQSYRKLIILKSYSMIAFEHRLFEIFHKKVLNELELMF